MQPAGLTDFSQTGQVAVTSVNETLHWMLFKVDMSNLPRKIHCTQIPVPELHRTARFKRTRPIFQMTCNGM